MTLICVLLITSLFRTQSRNCVFIWIMSYYKSDFGADKSVRMVPRSQQEIFFQDATESLSVITSG